MSIIRITVSKNKVKAFMQRCPHAIDLNPESKYGKDFAINKAVYNTLPYDVQKLAHPVIREARVTNYVKIVAVLHNTATGLVVSGRPRETVKLFVKEAETLKVLQGLEAKHNERSENGQFGLSVTMRKVAIPNSKSKLIAPIVQRSNEWLAANN